ncbi:MAG: hypothetical protein ACRC46_10545 [Thermoguttaceae bacterium]
MMLCTLKKTVLAFGMVLAVACSTLFANSDEVRPPIVSYRIAPNAILTSGFVRQLTSLPEWGPFSTSLTQAVFAALDRELSPSRLELFMSPEAAASVREAISRGDTIIDAVRKGISHVKGACVNVQVSPGHNRIDTMVAFLLDVNPRAALVGLAALKEGEDYEYILNKSNGFVVKFRLNVQGRTHEFGVAGVKLAGENRYAVLLAGCDDILARYEAFASGTCNLLDENGPAHELILDEAVFRFLAEQDQVRATGFGDLLMKVASLRATTTETDGAAKIDIVLTMKSDDDASTVRDLIAGMQAMLQMMPHDTKPEIAEAIAFVDSIKIGVEGASVSASISLDHQALWSLISRGLKEATKEIKKLPK